MNPYREDALMDVNKNVRRIGRMCVPAQTQKNRFTIGTFDPKRAILESFLKRLRKLEIFKCKLP